MQRRMSFVFTAAVLTALGSLMGAALPANATSSPNQTAVDSLDHIRAQKQQVTSVAFGTVNPTGALRVNATYYKNGTPISHELADATVNEQGTFVHTAALELEPGGYEVSYVLLDGEKAADTRLLGCDVRDASGTALVHQLTFNRPDLTCQFTVK